MSNNLVSYSIKGVHLFGVTNHLPQVSTRHYHDLNEILCQPFHLTQYVTHVFGRKEHD